MLQEETRKKSKKLAVGLFGAAIMLVTLGAGCGQPDATPTPAPVTTPPTTEPPAPEPTPAPVTTPPTSKNTYKDGTYTAQGTYAFHSGSESVNISLTLKGGLVTETTFQSVPSNGMSGRYQQMFTDGYKAMVVGKSLDEVCTLGTVSGSSLTPQGFDDACVKIQAQAKA